MVPYNYGWLVLDDYDYGDYQFVITRISANSHTHIVLADNTEPACW